MKWIALLALAWLLPPAAHANDRTLEQFVSTYARKHDFNGSILIQTGHHIRYAKSFGMANVQFKVPDTNQTRYWIASITKLYTSVLILQLEEQGRIDLGKTIGAYLPSYSGPGRDKVTIHELLDHTSGIRNYDQVKSAQDAIRSGLPNYQHPYTSDELMEKFASGPLVHEPGKVFDYNNGDYVILGKILERIYGAPYETILKKRILAPLGLSHTGLLHQHDIVPGLADTYFYRDDLKRLVNDLPVYPENWYAAGALYSTPRDLLKFANALFGYELIGKKTFAEMVRPGLDDYGYGLWSYDTKVDGRTHKVVKRPGRIMGAQSELFHVFDPDVTVIILSNTGTTDLDQFVADIGKIVIRSAH